VLDGRDWRQWRGVNVQLPSTSAPAGAVIQLSRRATDHFEATVTIKADGPKSWAAYWTVTENSHRTDVAAGENAGETLRNDHVVRQYTLAGQYPSRPDSPQALVLHAVGAPTGRERRINLVVFDPRNGHTIQALSLACLQK